MPVDEVRGIRVTQKGSMHKIELTLNVLWGTKADNTSKQRFDESTFVSYGDKTVKIQVNTGPGFFARNRKGKGAIGASVNKNIKKRETVVGFKLGSKLQIRMDGIKKAKKLR